MRQLALVGLVFSVLLGGVAVFETRENVYARRNMQDRALQGAVSDELSLLAGGKQQMGTAVSLVRIDPAVTQVLSDSGLPPPARSADLATIVASLATIVRSSFVPLTAACLDDEQGRQIACAPGSRSVVFPQALGRRFAAIAGSSPAGTTSGVFLSPASGQLSVASLTPITVGGRPLGLIHIDVSIAATRGASLLVENVPYVSVALGDYRDGHITLDGPASAPAASGLSSPYTLTVDGPALTGHPQSIENHGHRAMVATSPFTVGAARQTMAVVATYAHADPDLLNAWTPGLLTVLVVAALGLLGSTAGLAASNRRIARELFTDPLTGLRNRRALVEELPRVCQRATEEQPAYLWFFDLNGFKTYNDSFGHVAGDTLLTRLGGRLQEAVHRHGSVYRLGGDEFCALITRPVDDPHSLFLEARQALSEQGGAFAVESSAGAVEIPRETRDPIVALRLADQHMYREKTASRGGAAELITAVLHAALAQRHPDLGEHSDDVAGDVEQLARTIGLDEETIALISKAADLHDVGKLGIPDEIITKPGPLTEEEWEFMRQHTVMGEQIIAAAGPSLERIGPLVRASHERWDGKGYPDGLAGDEIPLGARIITICDSFRAMLDERVYKSAMSLEDALRELRRCAGTQFDPQLVEVFCRLVSEQTTLEPLPR